MNKINMAELLEDREKVHFSHDTEDAQQRRIDRLEDLGAAYIEAVEALRKINDTPLEHVIRTKAIARTFLEKFDVGE